MGFWTALLYDRVMGRLERRCLAAWRAELLAGLRGDVLDLGAGTGANLPHYPPGRFGRIVAVEPDRPMRRRLARRAGDFPRVEIVDAAAEALPFPAASFDAAVVTLVLCSVSDPVRALAELHRVLRPGGSLAFLEHVHAEHDPRCARWQRRLEPLWKHLADGCHLTRRTEAAIRDAGFRIERVERADMHPVPSWVRPTVRGIATRC
jgi:ubiquinone/menaquinone biosynthesis C-methylase UbiE